MKLKSKLIIGMLFVALLPLIVSMGALFSDNVSNTRQLAIDVAENELKTMAGKLSAYFSERISEVKTYARTPVIRKLSSKQFLPFLREEILYHNGRYEKFLVGKNNGHYHYTAGGNPHLDGVASFNDALPSARAKSIKNRDYWLYTLGNNHEQTEKTYVSNPMISYTTGAKQIMVAVSILDKNHNPVAMLGGSLPWRNIETRITKLRKQLENRLPWDTRFFLISPQGFYWYHWDEKKVVHIKTDVNGAAVLNEMGEKVSVRSRISEEKNSSLAAVGRRMLNSEQGYSFVTENETGKKFAIFYSPVESAGYSVGIQIPYNQLNQPVNQLIRIQSIIALGAILLVVFVAVFLSKRIAKPITSLRDAADEITRGRWDYPLPDGGEDEVSDLTRSFGLMTLSIKDREESLAVSEERFSLAMKGSNDGLWDWDIASGDVYLSPRWKEMLGYKEDEVEDTYESFESRIHPDDLERIKDNIKNYLNGRNDNNEAESRMQHKDGHYIDILSRVFAVRDSVTNKAYRVVGTNTDISERKKAEKAIIEAKEIAEHANNAKNLFLSNMSHELRTPLNAIIGFAEIIEHESDSNLSEAEKRSVSEISAAGWHLLDLINDILDLAKIEVGKLHINLTSVNLKQVLQECISVLSSESRENQISITQNISCDNNYLLADRLRLKQVLLNLMSNAIKYNQKGGRVSIDCSLLENKKLKISVTDTGVGIPEESLKAIFEPFNRLDAQDNAIEGTGVGLSISQYLMHLMGSDIGVESTLDKGSTFWISFKTTTPEEIIESEIKVEKGTSVMSDNKSELLILCVDDIPSNLTLIREVLSGVAGYQVMGATTGREGVELAEKHHPNLILMDLNMPGMNGTEAMQKIKNNSTTKSIPIIALSADALKSDIDEAKESGFDDYITKPFRFRELLAKVNEFLKTDS